MFVQVKSDVKSGAKFAEYIAESPPFRATDTIVTTFSNPHKIPALSRRLRRAVKFVQNQAVPGQLPGISASAPFASCKPAHQ